MALRICALCLVATVGLALASGDVTTLIQAQVAPDGDQNLPVAAAQRNSKEYVADGGNEEAMSDLLTRPEAVFKEMNKQVLSLQSEVDSIREHGKDVLASQQATFEAKYVEQQKANAELNASNTEIATSISQFIAKNRQLFNRGKELQNENSNMRLEIDEMRHKLADAGEFILEKTKELADVAPAEEAVIKEIEDFDAATRANEDHKEELDAISKFGKEQIDNRRNAALVEDEGDPATILKLMEDTVANLNEEQRASEAKLKGMYMKKFETEATKRAALLKNQARLVEKNESLKAMFHRLTAAIKHLEGVGDGLQQTISSLASFSSKLGKDHEHAARSTQEQKVSLSEEAPRSHRRSLEGDGPGAGLWSWIKGKNSAA